jgi:acetyl-CoA synthetase
MAMRPFFGIEPVLVNDKGEELKNNGSEGVLCIKQTWPSKIQNQKVLY